jgi:hypothetical protein
LGLRLGFCFWLQVLPKCEISFGGVTWFLVLAPSFAKMKNQFWGCDWDFVFGSKFRQDAKSVLSCDQRIFWV